MPYFSKYFLKFFFLNIFSNIFFGNSHKVNIEWGDLQKTVIKQLEEHKAMGMLDITKLMEDLIT